MGLIGFILRPLGILIGNILFMTVIRRTGYHVGRVFYRSLSPDSMFCFAIGTIIWAGILWYSVQALEYYLQQQAVQACQAQALVYNPVSETCEQVSTSGKAPVGKEGPVAPD